MASLLFSTLHFLLSIKLRTMLVILKYLIVMAKYLCYKFAIMNVEKSDEKRVVRANCHFNIGRYPYFSPS